MERSGHSNLRGVAPLAALDVAGRLAVPASVLAIADRRATLAAALAIFVNIAALVRGHLAGRAQARELERCHARLVRATCERSVAELSARPLDETSAMLAYGAERSARVATSTVPRLVADVVGLASLAAVLLVLAGPSWVLAGAGLGVLLGVPALAVLTRQRAAERSAQAELIELYAELDALFEGSAELRAHEREGGLVRELARLTHGYASAQSRASFLSTLLGVLPIGGALLLATGVAGAAPRMSRELAGSANGVVVAAIVASVLMHALSLLRTVEELLRSAPQRRLYTSYVTPRVEAVRAARAPVDPAAAPSASPFPSQNTERPHPWLRDAVIEVAGLSVRHHGARSDTPSGLGFRWPPGTGLALVGPNGSGKSTAALALLGVVPMQSGRVLVDGAPLDEAGFTALRRRVAFVAQRPYVAPSRSVAWHLRALAGDAVTDAELASALDAVGLAPTAAGGARIAERAAMTLSGGELRRAQLARMLLPHGGHPPELIVVDEPEAGLDNEGRRLVRELLAAAAHDARVLVIAHDRAVVPDGFQLVECRREG